MPRHKSSSVHGAFNAGQRARAQGARSRSGSLFPLRGKNLIALATGILVVVAAIVVFAADAAAKHGVGTGHHTGIGTTTHSTNSGSGGGGPAHSAPPGVSPSIGLAPGAVSPSATGLAEARTILPKLTPAQLAGQRVIYSYSGLTPPAQLLTLIRQGKVAGVIFFTDNISSESQIAAVDRQLQAANRAKSNPVRLPLLLMTDQEGGEVRRLPGAPLLSEKQVGEQAHPNDAALNAGKTGGENLHGVDMNLNLAPVLDVFRQPGNFIDEFGRSFSSDPSVVARLGASYAKAEQKQGVAATLKHFPGLGAATRSQNTDERPVTLNLSLSSIRNVDEAPYKSAIAAKAKLVMLSWAIYPALDSKFPAGLSSKIIGGELRNRLKFGGVTITDALEAGALNPFGSIAHRATLAARAGMDLLLCAGSTQKEGVSAANSLAFDYTHHSLNANAFKASVERILALRATLPG
jgi:beta-N-acetylhexosaminidase